MIDFGVYSLTETTPGAGAATAGPAVTIGAVSQDGLTISAGLHAFLFRWDAIPDPCVPRLFICGQWSPDGDQWGLLVPRSATIDNGTGTFWTFLQDPETPLGVSTIWWFPYLLQSEGDAGEAMATMVLPTAGLFRWAARVMGTAVGGLASMAFGVEMN